MTITWGKDLGSSVDYLETRADIDATRLAYMGHSMGTRFAPMMLATVRRFRTVILLAGAMRPVGALPEVDPANFLPRVTIPVLPATGQYDAIYPVDVAQKPFFDLIGIRRRTNATSFFRSATRFSCRKSHDGHSRRVGLAGPLSR